MPYMESYMYTVPYGVVYVHSTVYGAEGERMSHLVKLLLPDICY